MKIVGESEVRLQLRPSTGPMGEKGDKGDQGERGEPGPGGVKGDWRVLIGAVD